MFSLSCITILIILPLNFGISKFGNLTRASEDFDDVKEIFTGLLIAGFTRNSQFLLKRLQFRPLLSKFHLVLPRCPLAQVQIFSSNSLTLFSLSFIGVFRIETFIIVF